MKIIQINLGNFGSTGGIARGINAVARSMGMETRMSYPWDPNNRNTEKYDIQIGNEFGRKASRKLARVMSYNGCFSVFSTISFLSKLGRYNPDVIHLHNLHNSYINLPILFRYIKKHNINVVWTLHDCWAFTGQCPHFTLVKCGRWKTGCYNCSQYKSYPESLNDNSKRMWKLKRKWFTGVKNMTIVTPSRWLAGLVKESFLQEYPIRIINNGIDSKAFKPTESNFRKKNEISDEKYVVLGVAFDWGYRKGLDVFLELEKRLDDKYNIVLVGTDENIDGQLPANIISVHRTQNQKELAEIYSAADVFVNPTREENYPTVNMEALACGTPVLTFQTGGSPESIDETCGNVVACDDINLLQSEIRRICETRPYSKEDCLKKAKNFDQNKKFKEYIELYKNLNV